MSSDAQPRSGRPAGPVRPSLVDVGCLLIAAAALINILIGALVAVQATSTTLPVQPGLVAVVVVISVVYSAALIVLALLLRSGRAWARGALLGVSALSLLTLFAPNALNLLVILLLVVAVWVLHRRSVGAWVRALRGISSV